MSQLAVEMQESQPDYKSEKTAYIAGFMQAAEVIYEWDKEDVGQFLNGNRHGVELVDELIDL